VIMEETGVVNVADPLGGSWYLEALTDRLEAEAGEIFGRILAMSPDDSVTGGILRGIEEGWFSSEIAEASFAYQKKLEKGDKKVVGVNCHVDTTEQPLEILRVSHEVEREQVAALRGRRAGRDQASVDAALTAMIQAARSGENMVPPILEAARAEATLGEICGTLRDEWGGYREPPSF
jgi:methylmalonyl-CoA mutase N-terminal domain/subunit